MKTYEISGGTVQMEYPPSDQQKAAAKCLLETIQNIILDAKAGTGKTTTIKILTDLLLSVYPNVKILMIAFNTDIVKELKERMDPRIEVRTSHSLGMSILRHNARRRNSDIGTQNNKAYQTLQVMLKYWGLDMNLLENQDKAKTILKLCDLARQSLCDTVDQVEIIAEKHDLLILDNEAQLTLDFIDQLNKDTRTIDFVDMIYMPYVHAENLKFPEFDFVFVDECQDLSLAQQFLMKACIKPDTGRFVAVGDESQAIYGFAGSDSESFRNLQKSENTITLPLNKCYRCSKEIIKYVRQATGSEIEAFDGMPEGEAPRDASITELRDGDFVMCRNTYPLVKLCFHLLGLGKAATIKGRDIGTGLQNIIKATKTDNLDAMAKRLDTELNKTYMKIQKKNPHMTKEEVKEQPTFQYQSEKHAIIKLIGTRNEDVKTTRDLIYKIFDIFTEAKNGGIVLSTIHKSKGLEFDRCFIIERDLMPSKMAKKEWQMEQENNLIYVCYTRAKKELLFISDWSYKDGYSGNDPEEQKLRPQSKYVGTVGGERVPMICKIIDTMTNEGKYGSYTIYEMEDENGNTIVKFGTINDFYYLDPDRVAFNAEIKDHKTFRGENRTIIGKVSKYEIKPA